MDRAGFGPRLGGEQIGAEGLEAPGDVDQLAGGAVPQRQGVSGAGAEQGAAAPGGQADQPVGHRQRDAQAGAVVERQGDEPGSVPAARAGAGRLGGGEGQRRRPVDLSPRRQHPGSGQSQIEGGKRRSRHRSTLRFAVSSGQYLRVLPLQLQADFQRFADALIVVDDEHLHRTISSREPEASKS